MDFQTKVIAQGLAGVVGAEQAALLQDRHDFIGEGVELAGEERWHDVQAVGGTCLESVLQHVGDLCRTADQLVRSGSRGGLACFEGFIYTRTQPVHIPPVSVWPNEQSANSQQHSGDRCQTSRSYRGNQ